MKLTFVTPRYGLEVTGGAELGARMISERLVSQLGWEVDVLTTRARDASTWANWYPVGLEEIKGVRVHRFTASGRAPNFDAQSQPIMAAPHAASREQQEHWFELQGPVSYDLITAIRNNDADVIAFYPYLYHPTVFGISEVSDRAIMHPAAHDEPPIHLPIFSDVFDAAAGFAYHTESERRLVERLFDVAQKPAIELGLGAEVGEADSEHARKVLGVGSDPYVVCVGRVDNGKGTGMLATFFARYKERYPGPLKLVFIGPVVDQPLRHPDIVVAGRVEEEVKWGAIAGAQALISPSGFESFSIVLLEAWSLGTPVIVNARCHVTSEHVVLSGGGLTFDGYPDFEVAIDKLCGDQETQSQLAKNGSEYVERFYQWPDIIDRYASFVSSVSDRARSVTS